MAITALGAVVCDDVRREDNGKELLIGVYSAELNVIEFPAKLRLFFWLMVKADEAGEYKFLLRVTGPDDAELVRGEAMVVLVRGGDASAPIGPIPIQVKSDGQLILEIQFPGEDWYEVKRLPIRVVS